ncbi:uncharacterized protein CTRU02_201341 [Colletotrichum truncatum]|uniref:Uncharacterized protein n=1 Tax=Colletotrichum truncatum TaxID=5467 RepID=A0ACC3ZH06_COLTU|nr:uncharacterized protein CTRU02_08133 [Colletotrichum truncatum]KAF6790613.1 hypothetical protein CTRU02_08133 [Colletotrichum truncatum]
MFSNDCAEWYKVLYAVVKDSNSILRASSSADGGALGIWAKKLSQYQSKSLLHAS